MELEDLETRLDDLKNLRNDFVVEDGDRKVVYVGEAKGLYFEGLDIRGQPKLTRYARTEGTKSKLEVVSWFPPKLARKEIPSVKDKKVWSFVPEYNFYDFVYQGNLDSDYKRALVNLASKKGILLSRKLLDLVFRSIDKELMRIYHKVARKE